MAEAKVKPCTCEHEEQDKMYGKSKRLCNPKDKKGEYKCTACGRIHKE